MYDFDGNTDEINACAGEVRDLCKKIEKFIDSLRNSMSQPGWDDQNHEKYCEIVRQIIAALREITEDDRQLEKILTRYSSKIEEMNRIM